MIKKIILILILTSSFYSIGQPTVSGKITGIDILGLKVDFSSKYTKAEITYNNGEKKLGYIYGFIQNKAISFKMQNPFSSGSYDDALNLSDKSFSFKTDLNQKETTITSNEINEVKIINDSISTTHYKLMNLFTVNKDGTIKNLKKKVWLPFYKEDVINVFSYDIYEELEDSKGYGTGKFEKSATMIYLNNPKNNDAINVRDFSVMDAFSKKNLLNKWSGGLKEVFKDCPKFITANIDTKGIWNFDSNYFNVDQYDEKEKQIKKNKEIKRKEREYQLNILDTEMQISPYVKMIDDYKLNCK